MVSCLAGIGCWRRNRVLILAVVPDRVEVEEEVGVAVSRGATKDSQRHSKHLASGFTLWIRARDLRARGRCGGWPGGRASLQPCHSNATMAADLHLKP